MFLELMKLTVLFLSVVLIFVPIIVNVNKNSLYNEWKEIWRSEIEAEKRKLAMEAVIQDRNKLVKKTKKTK